MDKEKILNKMNVSYIGEIDFAGRKYMKVLNTKKPGAEYEYYEVVEENLIKVSDQNLIKSIKSIYEIDSNDVIY